MRTLYLRRSTHIAHWAPVLGRQAAIYKWQSGISTAVAGTCLLLFIVSEVIGVRGHVGAFRVVGYCFLAGGIAALYYSRIALRRAYAELRRRRQQQPQPSPPSPRTPAG